MQIPKACDSHSYCNCLEEVVVSGLISRTFILFLYVVASERWDLASGSVCIFLRKLLS